MKTSPVATVGGMFVGSNCSNTADPNLSATPESPLCGPCL